MKRVLVTGARGFLGRQCLPLLRSRADQVIAVTSQDVPSDAATSWRRANLLDPQQVRKLLCEVRPTHLLHLAWITTPGVFWEAPENWQWLEASKHLLDQFHAWGGHRAAVAGTCAEYDWSHGVCHEHTTALKPNTVYGQCKHSLQLHLSALSQDNDMSAAWARLFFLYGPGASDEKFPGVTISALLRGLPAKCTDGRQARDFLHVGDAADAMVALLDSDVAGAVNIASGLSVRIRDVALTIAEKLGRVDLLQLGAIQPRVEEPPSVVADVGRLRDEVQWSPRYNLPAGLDETISQWKESLQTNAAA